MAAKGTPDPAKGSGVDPDDLDALRAQRLELAPERPPVVFAGRKWVLVPELPFALGDLWQRHGPVVALTAVFADPGPSGAKDRSTSEERIALVVEEFMACHPSDADVAALLSRFGVTLGKSSAS